MSFMQKIFTINTFGGTAEALGGGKFANGTVTGAFVMMLNHLMHDGDGNKGKGNNGTNSVEVESNLPAIDGQAGPWSIEYITEKTLEYGSNPMVGVVAHVTDDLLMISKGMGYVFTGLSFANDSYHYFLLEDISTGRYLYRVAGTGVGVTLSVIGSGAAPLIGPTVVFYERAFDYIKTTYRDIDNRLNSKQWWGLQYGF